MKYKDADKLEALGRLLLRRVKDAWFRVRVATGTFRGITVDANSAGKITQHSTTRVIGLCLAPGDTETRIVIDGVDVLALNPREP